MQKFDQKPKNNFVRVNFQIKVPNVRVVWDEKQLGIMRTEVARALAQDNDLDLIEVVPYTKPPVCHIMRWDKYRYDLKQKEKDQKRKQKTQEIKDLRLTPGIQLHDIETKIMTARKFLESGKKVQFNLLFRRRELAHKEAGFKVVHHIVNSLQDCSTTELIPKLEGNRIICRLMPKSV